MGLRTTGTLVYWHFGLFYGDYGLLEFWPIGSSSYWDFGLLELQPIGTSVYWHFGLLTLRLIDTSVYWDCTLFFRNLMKKDLHKCASSLQAVWRAFYIRWKKAFNNHIYEHLSFHVNILTISDSYELFPGSFFAKYVYRNEERNMYRYNHTVEIFIFF